MYAKFGYKGHNGLDYACPTGTQILAPISGKVIEAANDTNGYGLYIKIENDKEGVVLGHNKSLSVKVGDIVTEGQKIAISNNTGNSTGPHCHFGYYPLPRDRANGYGGFVDQSKLLVAQPLPSTEPTMTTEETNILNFLKEKKATEGMVREAFGALADIPNMKEKITDLEKNQESLTESVEKLKLSIGEKDKTIEDVTEELRVIKEEKQTWQDKLDYYMPFKSRYEEALTKIPNSLTGWDLIIAGIKKLTTKK